MTSYSAVVTGYFTPGTDQIAIEIDAPANTIIKIKKIRITHSDGQHANVEDSYKALDLVIQSVGTTGGSLYTPIEVNDSATVSKCIVTVGPAPKGTIFQTIDTISIHAGTDFVWQAADEDDKIVIQPGQIFAVVVNAAA